MPFKFKKFSAQKLTLIAFIYLPVSGTKRFQKVFFPQNSFATSPPPFSPFSVGSEQFCQIFTAAGTRGIIQKIAAQRTAQSQSVGADKVG